MKGNNVAKHSHKANKAAIFVDRKKESKRKPKDSDYDVFDKTGEEE
jgi:hypothetical protein